VGRTVAIHFFKRFRNGLLIERLVLKPVANDACFLVELLARINSCRRIGYDADTVNTTANMAVYNGKM